jgi:phosphate uptake regulator
VKRKVIQLGKNSLLVSLPSSWVKKHGVTKGAEVALEEKDSTLVLQPPSAQTRLRTSIDVTNLAPIVKRALGALYKKGYDEFTVHFSDHEELELAHEVIREEFIGFEVVQHGKNHLVVREISQPHADQFDAVLRRQFLVIKDYAQDAASALADKDHPWLKRLVLRDKDVNKLADFCRRLINKNQGTKLSTGLYFIVEQLEKISDRYRDICKHAAEKKLAPGNPLLAAYKDIAQYLDDFYRCFYQFSLPAVSAFVKKHAELVASLERASGHASREEQRVFFWLEDIADKLHDMNGALMTAHL